MVDLVEATDITDQTWVWVAGEAAAVQAIRRDLLGERSIPRSRAVIRGYWKHGRYPDGH
jgi:NADPH-dependent ferric siderophore reductase